VNWLSPPAPAEHAITEQIILFKLSQPSAFRVFASLIKRFFLGKIATDHVVAIADFTAGPSDNAILIQGMENGQKSRYENCNK